MFIAIANAIGANKKSVDKNVKIIDAFKARVLADGGTFEAESCLLTFLTQIN